MLIDIYMIDFTFKDFTHDNLIYFSHSKNNYQYKKDMMELEYSLIMNPKKYNFLKKGK